MIVGAMSLTQSFAVKKRYSDFYTLREALLLSWPGFYIPPVPEKKTFGNTEKEFILERKEALHMFVRQIAKFEFMVHSVEFKLFL
jgi:sorting nexin-1/2